MGSNITPETISLSKTKPTEIQKWGMPFIKFVVPSIGSITQKLSLSSFLIKPLSSVKKEYFFFHR